MGLLASIIGVIFVAFLLIFYYIDSKFSFMVAAFVVLFIINAILFYFNASLLVCAIMSLACVLSFIDAKKLAIPDILNAKFLALCIALAFVEYADLVDSMTLDYMESDIKAIYQNDIYYRILAGFGVGGVFFALKIFYQSLFNKDIIGEADIVFLSALGIAFSPETTFISVFFGSILALIYALFIYARFRKPLKSLKFPFCTFVSLGFVIDALRKFLGFI